MFDIKVILCAVGIFKVCAGSIYENIYEKQGSNQDYQMDLLMMICR